MKLYTSEEIENAEDLYELQDSFASSAIPFKYQMTEGELQWLDFVRGRYAIADWIQSNLDNNGILTFNCPFAMSAALNEDSPGWCKAVMLSDETALQRLFFWLCEEPEEDTET